MVPSTPFAPPLRLGGFLGNRPLRNNLLCSCSIFLNDSKRKIWWLRQKTIRQPIASNGGRWLDLRHDNLPVANFFAVGTYEKKLPGIRVARVTEHLVQ